MSDKNTELLQSLMAKMEQMTASHEAMAQKVDSLSAENQELKKSLAKDPNKAPEKPKVPKELFEVEGVKYRFRVAKFSLPALKGENQRGAQSITAVDALASPETLQRLVAAGSGVIEEVAE